MNAEKPESIAALSAFILFTPSRAKSVMQQFPIPQPVEAKARRNALLTLILTSVIFGMLLIPGLGAMRVLPVVFDAPESAKNPRLIAFAIALLSYPVLALVSIIGSWTLYAWKRYGAATGVSLLPLLSILAAFICFLLLEI